MDVLKKIVGWMEHAKDTPAVVAPAPANEDDRKLPTADEYETELCAGLDDDGKVDMVLGANLLDIKYLLGKFFFGSTQRNLTQFPLGRHLDGRHSQSRQRPVP